MFLLFFPSEAMNYAVKTFVVENEYYDCDPLNACVCILFTFCCVLMCSDSHMSYLFLRDKSLYIPICHKWLNNHPFYGTPSKRAKDHWPFVRIYNQNRKLHYMAFATAWVAVRKTSKLQYNTSQWISFFRAFVL